MMRKVREAWSSHEQSSYAGVRGLTRTMTESSVTRRDGVCEAHEGF